MKLCCVFNYNPLYRLPIYKKIDSTYNADFFFGKPKDDGIQQFDPSLLLGYKGLLNENNLNFHGLRWYSGVGKVLRTEYTHYLITGDSSQIAFWIIILFCRITRKKVYVWTHGLYGKETGLSKIVAKIFFTISNGSFIYSQYSAHFVGALSKNLYKRIFVIHNSLDTGLQTTIFKELKPSKIYQSYFENSNPTFIYIGRIQRRKKVYQILLALSLLKKQNINYNLTIVGGYCDEEPFDELINDLGLQNNVWLYGPCYEEEKNAELLYNACACVSPGNVGLTSIHSLSYGTPVISHSNFSAQMPEFEAIEEGITGSFYQQDNIEELAVAMRYWASVSDAKREETKKRAREKVVTEWSVDYQIQLLKSVIK